MGNSITMKRAFVLTPDRHLASALVPIETADVIHVGDRLSVSRPLDVGRGAFILPGECGTVNFVDLYTGSVELLLDKPHEGLSQWDNHLLIEPFNTDDINGGLQFHREPLRAKVARLPRWAHLVVIACIVGVLAALADNYFLVEPLYEFANFDFHTTSHAFSRGFFVTMSVAIAVNTVGSA